MAVKITDIEISCDACLDEIYEAPILHFEDIDSVIQCIKDAGGVYVGSRSLGVGTEESDYDFIVDSIWGESWIESYEKSGNNARRLSDADYIAVDAESWGEGFTDNIKMYYYDANDKCYCINLFLFECPHTLDKYKKLQEIMLKLPKDLVSDKGERVKHFAHIQSALDISEYVDVPYDDNLFVHYSKMVP